MFDINKNVFLVISAPLQVAIIMMDSGSESEDEVFFGPVTEKEMTVRNLRGINEEER